MTMTFIAGGLLALIIIIYVILDGFDLGLGILFPFVKDNTQRDLMMHSVAPVWDGNETWLVFGAAILYATFPLAYAVLLPALYLPIILMLIALIFRGISFEFRFKAQKSRFIWNWAFALGSTLAAFLQGAILGTYVKGFIMIDKTHYVIAQPSWLTPFSFMTGLAVVAGYGLLGATWMIIKSQAALQQRMYQAAEFCLIAVAIFLIIVTVWTPYHDPVIIQRWFRFPDFFYLLPFPILATLAVFYTLHTLNKRYEYLPFFLSIAIFLFSYIGLCLTVWPYIIPRVVTIWEAAAPRSSQLFTLVGALIIMPLLLIYTWYAYRVFRGKVSLDSGYGH